jgi:two-component sensor histidine kinase
VDGQVEVTVSDEGVGMDPAAPRTESLGTTIVRALTRQIGAELTLSSAPGRGTTVTLRLPRKA